MRLALCFSVALAAEVKSSSSSRASLEELQASLERAALARKMLARVGDHQESTTATTELSNLKKSLARKNLPLDPDSFVKMQALSPTLLSDTGRSLTNSAG